MYIFLKKTILYTLLYFSFSELTYGIHPVEKLKEVQEDCHVIFTNIQKDVDRSSEKLSRKRSPSPKDIEKHRAIRQFLTDQLAMHRTINADAIAKTSQYTLKIENSNQFPEENKKMFEEAVHKDIDGLKQHCENAKNLHKMKK